MNDSSFGIIYIKVNDRPSLFLSSIFNIEYSLLGFFYPSYNGIMVIFNDVFSLHTSEFITLPLKFLIDHPFISHIKCTPFSLSLNTNKNDVDVEAEEEEEEEIKSYQKIFKLSITEKLQQYIAISIDTFFKYIIQKIDIPIFTFINNILRILYPSLIDKGNCIASCPYFLTELYLEIPNNKIIDDSSFGQKLVDSIKFFIYNILTDDPLRNLVTKNLTNLKLDKSIMNDNMIKLINISITDKIIFIPYFNNLLNLSISNDKEQIIILTPDNIKYNESNLVMSTNKLYTDLNNIRNDILTNNDVIVDFNNLIINYNNIANVLNQKEIPLLSGHFSISSNIIINDDRVIPIILKSGKKIKLSSRNFNIDFLDKDMLLEILILLDVISDDTEFDNLKETIINKLSKYN